MYVSRQKISRQKNVFQDKTSHEFLVFWFICVLFSFVEDGVWKAVDGALMPNHVRSNPIKI
jgi:hypothetical protein